MSTDPTEQFDLPDHPLTRTVLAVEQAAWRRRQSHHKGSASSSSIRSTPRRSSVRCGPISTSGRPTASRRRRFTGSDARRRHARAAAAAVGRGLSEHSRRDLHGPENNTLPVQLWTELLQDLCPDDQSAGLTPPYEDNPANGPIYPSYVPKTDSDGNDIAGIRLPELTVPLATYTGWGLRSGVWANDGCEGSGQYIPFAATTGRAHRRRAIRALGSGTYPSYADIRARSIGGRQIGAAPLPDLRRHPGHRDTAAAAGLAAGVPAPGANENTSAPDPVPAGQGRMPPHGITIITSSSVIMTMTMTVIATDISR